MTLREELIQVAAVAVAIVTDLDQGSTKVISHTGRWTVAHRAVIADVVNERVIQEQKWGERHGVPIADWLVILGEEYGEACRSALEEVMYPAGVVGEETP